MGEDTIYCDVGFESLDIKIKTWFEWVEHNRNSMRRVTLSLKVMQCVCHVFNTTSKEQSLIVRDGK